MPLTITLSSTAVNGTKVIASVYAGGKLAERVGFEPTLPFRVNTLSKRAPSATRPSLLRAVGTEKLFAGNLFAGYLTQLQMRQLTSSFCSAFLEFFSLIDSMARVAGTASLPASSGALTPNY